jgi:NAD(P)-dependent dehydrogenase (short-subunit alcohol dehydrogenase family)
VSSDPMDSAAGGRRVALINGGSRGMGLAVAERLVARGWRVCITGRKEDRLRDAVASLSCAAGDVLAVAGAAQDPVHQRETVQAVLSEWSRLDVLINNAATSPHLGNLLDGTAEQFIKGFTVNVIAAFQWSQLAWQQYMAEHGGSILNMGSVGGTYPVPRVGMYNVTKAALHQMTRQLALELAPNVRVNALAPATIKTDFSRAKYEGREQKVAEQFPLRRLGEPGEVADIAVQLCDGPFGWMTGQTLIIDGGASLVVGVR